MNTIILKPLGLQTIRRLRIFTNSFHSSYLYSSKSVAHVCIIGSGPAAFYTAQNLLKGRENIKVDIYERLPVPFGLVRYGVAPDHPDVKNVINTFTQVAKDHRFSYAGNVNVGTDVSIAELQRAYHAVILAYGAAKDKKLNIPGEKFQNVYSAKDFVGWYNGLPECQSLNPLLDCDSAVVIGHGNVALDICRILLSSPELLARTDIPQQVLSHFLPPLNRIRRVHLVGRRGPLQVAFTIKEFREMLKLPGVRTWIHSGLAEEEGAKNWPEVILPPLNELSRPRRRLTELIIRAWKDQPHLADMAASGTQSSSSKEFHLHFLRSPKLFLPAEEKHNERVEGVVFVKTALEGSASEEQKVKELPFQFENMKGGLAIYSIGYSAIRIDPFLPFDERRSLIPNIGGRVIESPLVPGSIEKPPIIPGLYCVGWIKRGPIGVILTTIPDAKETSDVVLEDLTSSVFESETKLGFSSISALLKSKGVRTVSFDDWIRIDKLEQLMGHSFGKPREKLLSPIDMLKAAFQEAAEERISKIDENDLSNKK